MDTEAVSRTLTIPFEVRMLHHDRCTGRLFLFTDMPEGGNYYQCSCGRLFPLAPRSAELVTQVIA